MKYSPLIKNILMDLAKNPIPKEYRKYGKGGKYIGEKGGRFDDIREYKSNPSLSPDPAPSSGVQVINSGGHLYNATRTAETHTGKHTLTISVYSQTDTNKLYDEIQAESKKTGDIIEKDTKLSLQDKQRIWERSEAGEQMASAALTGFEGEPDVPARLFVVRENGVLKAVGNAYVFNDQEVTIDRLGTVGLSGNGAGSTILKEIMAWAKDMKIPTITLESLSDSMTFYEKHGFGGSKYYTCELKFCEIETPSIPKGDELDG